MSSIFGIVTPILMTGSRSRERASRTPSLNQHDSTSIKSPTNLVRSLGSHSITGCLQASNPLFTPSLWHLSNVAPAVVITSMQYICVLRALSSLSSVALSLVVDDAFVVVSSC